MTDPMPAPPGLKAAGRAYWANITARFDLEDHEAALLVEAARTVDTLAALDARVRRDGYVLTGQTGPRPHPCAVEARHQRLTLARLQASLRLPDDEGERPQRRGAARGTYGQRPAAGDGSEVVVMRERPSRWR